MKTEPVALTALLTAAATLTLNLVALAAEWSPEIVAAANASVAAWIAVLGFFVRGKVTPWTPPAEVEGTPLPPPLPRQ